MDADAFSSDKVVQASSKLILVLVDCSGGKFKDERTKYEVGGYPSIVFLDPDGNKVGKLGDRSPDGVVKQFEELAEKHGRAAAWLEWDVAVEQAKEQKKPVVILFTTPKADSQALETAVADDLLKDLRERFVCSKAEIKSDLAKRFKVSGGSQPVLIVADPNLEKPEEKLLKKLTGKKSAKELKKELESAIKKFEAGK